MPLLAKAISPYSALPPSARLDRIRALATGKSPIPPPSPLAHSRSVKATCAMRWRNRFTERVRPSR
jgi:hypothetical protein